MAGAKKAIGAKKAGGKPGGKPGPTKPGGKAATAASPLASSNAVTQAATAAAAADVIAEIQEERKRELLQKQIPAAAGEGDDSEGAAIPSGSRNKDADAAAMLRSMGEHIDTRRTGEDMEADDEGLGDDLYDEVGEGDGASDVDETFRPLAAGLPAASIELVSAQVATGQMESGNLFIGHNRNTVTSVAAIGDTIVYADKLGVTTKVTFSSRTSYAAPAREMFLPHVDEQITAVAISDTTHGRHNQGLTRTTADLSVTSFVAVGTAKGLVRIWNFATMEHVGDLTLHRAAVTGLAFRMNTSTLVSVSRDKVVRAWNVHSMAPLDRFFGHQAAIMCVAALRAERCVTVGEDRVPHMWKLDRATQVAYGRMTSPGDACALIDEATFVVGTRSGSLLLFDSLRKAPVWRKDYTHGYGWGGDGTGMEREGRTAQERFGAPEAPADAIEAFGNGITALAAVPFSDLVVSASFDGFVRIWRYRSPEIDSSVKDKTLEQVGQAAVFGFVNAITFAHDGREIVCAVGKEPRFGRWLVQRAARNGVQRIPLSSTGAAPKRSVVRDAEVKPLDNRAEAAELKRLMAQASQPTKREVMMADRVTQKAAAAAGKKHTPQKGAAPPQRHATPGGGAGPSASPKAEPAPPSAAASPPKPQTPRPPQSPQGTPRAAPATPASASKQKHADATVAATPGTAGKKKLTGKSPSAGRPSGTGKASPRKSS